MRLAAVQDDPKALAAGEFRAAAQHESRIARLARSVILGAHLNLGFQDILIAGHNDFIQRRGGRGLECFQLALFAYPNEHAAFHHFPIRIDIGNQNHIGFLGEDCPIRCKGNLFQLLHRIALELDNLFGAYV